MTRKGYGIPSIDHHDETDRRRPRAVVACATAALLVALLGVTVAPASAVPLRSRTSPVRIVTPSAGLVTQHHLTVVVNTAPRLRRFSASLGAKNVRRSFHRSRPGRWVGTLNGISRIGAGPVQLLITTVDDGGRRGAASVQLLIGRRSKSYLSLVPMDSRRSAPGTAVSIRLGPDPSLFTVTLNGRDATREFPGVGHVRIGTLTTTDGLRYGRNRLVITAARANGTYGRVVQTFVVPRRWPLLGGPSVVHSRSGDVVPLTAAGTIAARRGDVMTYHWALVKRPRGSHARIATPDAMRATIKTDRPGVYRARMTVIERPRPGATLADTSVLRATKTVSVSNAALIPPIGLAVNTMATLPDGYPGIVLGTGPSDPNYQAFSNVYGYSLMVVLDRATLAVKFHMQWNWLGAPAEVSYINSLPTSDLVIVSNEPASTESLASNPTPGWSQVLKALGATPTNSLADGFSVIGVPNSPGSGISNSQGGMTGYLQYDANTTYPSYTFVLGQYASYATSSSSSSTSNTMTVDGQSYPSLSINCPSDGGGLELVALNALTLSPVAQNTWVTNCGNPAADQQQLTDLANQLTALASAANGPDLLFLQSIGDPYPSDASNQWYQVGLDLAAFGGTPGVFNTATGAYALAGSNGLSEAGSIANFGAEASSSMTGQAGTLSGELRRDSQYHFEPIVGEPGLTGTQAMIDLVYPQQPLAPWYSTSTPARQQIITYISEHTLSPAPNYPDPASCFSTSQPDVRADYCDLSEQPYEISWANQLEAATNPPAGTGFSATDWNAVRDELADELNTVPKVFQYIGYLQGVYGGSSPYAQVQQIYTQIEAQIAPPASAAPGVIGFWTGLFGDVFNVASLVPGLDTVFGVLGAGLHIAADAMAEPDGAPELNASTLGTSAIDLGAQLASRYGDMSRQMGTLANIIVSDPGKLHAFYDDPDFDYGENQLAGAGASLNLSTERYAYGQLLSAAYRLDEVNQDANNNPPWCPLGNPTGPCSPPTSGFVCSIEGFDWRPFKDAPAQAQIVVPIPKVLGNRGDLYVVADPTIPGGWYPDPMPWLNPEQYVPTPSAGLLGPLFEPLSDNGGLGLFPQWFYAHYFPMGSPGTAANSSPYEFACQT